MYQKGLWEFAQVRDPFLLSPRLHLRVPHGDHCKAAAFEPRCFWESCSRKCTRMHDSRILPVALKLLECFFPTVSSLSASCTGTKSQGPVCALAKNPLNFNAFKHSALLVSRLWKHTSMLRLKAFMPICPCCVVHVKERAVSYKLILVLAIVKRGKWE